MSTDIERTAPRLPSARVSQSTVIEQSRAVAEVQAAILVAQQFPRDLRLAWDEMRQACSRITLAGRAFYTVPNRGQNKPSVHLARELARIWRNLDYGVKELSRDDAAGESEVQAYSWDQQTNVRSTRSFIVPHARMTKAGRKALTDLGDIYLNNQNIGARAVRETILTVLPDDFVEEAQEICRATIEKGDGKPLHEQAAAMVTAFADYNVTQAQLETRIGRKLGYWTPSDLADLKVLGGSIKRGELRAEDEFPPEHLKAKDITGGTPTASPPSTPPTGGRPPGTDLGERRPDDPDFTAHLREGGDA